MDFRLDINHDRKIRILQITDMQIIDANQRRYPDRLIAWEIDRWVPEKNEQNIYAHIRCLVKKTNPDLIVITGDIVYGEFDDSGKTFCEFCDFMDSLEIPWAPVYGNHDNESQKGIEWQCNRFKSSRNCLFAKGEVFGNGNYTIGIYRNDKLLRVIYMMDSNGCGKLKVPTGFKANQLEWMTACGKEHGGVPAFVFFHIPTVDFYNANLAAGYQSCPDVSNENFAEFEIGVDVPAQNGDFGKKRECITLTSMGESIMPQLKSIGADGVFAGHCHMVNTSVLYEGIRFTYAYKTGLYDYYDRNALGGTCIELDGSDFTVNHVLVDEELRLPSKKDILCNELNK